VIQNPAYRLAAFYTPSPWRGASTHKALFKKRKMHAGAAKEIYQRARELRNRSTHAEDILWGYLKNKPQGFKFRRQHPYSIYILDFYCHPLKLVIEIDGSSHDSEEAKIYDLERQKLIEEDGLMVIRFKNEEVLYKLEEVIHLLNEFILNNRNVSPGFVR